MEQEPIRIEEDPRYKELLDEEANKTGKYYDYSEVPKSEYEEGGVMVLGLNNHNIITNALHRFYQEKLEQCESYKSNQEIYCQFLDAKEKLQQLTAQIEEKDKVILETKESLTRYKAVHIQDMETIQQLEYTIEQLEKTIVLSKTKPQ